MNRKSISLITMFAFMALLQGCVSTAPTPPVQYQSVIEFDGEPSKDVLFTKTRLWLAETFVDSKEVIELADKDSGVLVGNGGMNFTFPLVAPMPGKFSMRIDIKDGRARTTYSNFQIFFSGQYNKGWSVVTTGMGNDYPEQAISTAKQLNSSLKAFVEGAEQDDDW